MSKLFPFLDPARYDFLVPVMIMAIVFYGLYRIIELLAHRKERLMAIEKFQKYPFETASPAGPVSLQAKSSRERLCGNRCLRTAGLVLGIGVGCLLGYMIIHGLEFKMVFEEMMPLVLMGMLLVCGALGMIGGFFIERKLDKTDHGEKCA